jgi:hypothetical protein
VRLKFRRANSLLFLIVVCLFAGCNWERSTRVQLESKPSLTFALSGSGDLSSFSVYQVSPADFEIGRRVDSFSLDSSFTRPAVWSIIARPDWLHGRRVEYLGSLTYGEVPSGYDQKIPANGSTPPAIIPGRQYFFDCDTTNAPGARGGFQMSDGKIVPVVIGIPCIGGTDGKLVTVPCLK